MKRTKLSTVLVAVGVLALSGTAFAVEYAGSEACSKCHMAKYNDWKTSGHPYKLRPASVAKYDSLPVPKGYSWDDISYVIGGHRWKARYIDKEGYIITTDKQGNKMPTQWNIHFGKWVDYHPGEKKPYKCGPCHMTGYNEEGHQDGLEGIVGTWAAPGIHCEECHGPGGVHAMKGKEGLKIERSAALCGKCHVRGEPEKIPAKKGFIRHHEQYNEYLASPHKDKLMCVTCHDPHKPARFGIKLECGTCHGGQKTAFEGSSMHKAGIKCIDCHMPRVSKSAELISPREGDMRTHNWKISTDPDASMFTEDGKYATGILTLNIVCLNCHGSRDMKWAAEHAEDIHSYGK
jgi:hypothetical protein